jgi:hypothetical protein
MALAINQEVGYKVILSGNFITRRINSTIYGGDMNEK